MAKKRKGQAARPTKATADEEVDHRKGASMKSWMTIDDIEGDSEDEFHAQREVVRFDDDQNDDSDDFGGISDEEVFGIDAGDSDDDLDDEDDRLLGKAQQHLLRNRVLSDDEDDAKPAAKDDADKGWGRSRKQYYDADEVDLDEEDARLEEEEALRLQKERLEKMAEEDFLGDDDDEIVTKEVGIDKDADEQAFESLDVSDRKDALKKLDPKTLHAMAKTRIPEICDLLTDFETLMGQWKDLFGPNVKPEDVKQHAFQFHLLSSYFVNASFYLALRSHPSFVKSDQKHPALESLTQISELISFFDENQDDMVTPFDEDAEIGEDDTLSDALYEEELEEAEKKRKAEKKLSKKRKTRPADDEELEEKDEVIIPQFKSLKKQEKKLAKDRLATKGQFTNDFSEAVEGLDDADLEDKISRTRNLRFQVSAAAQRVGKKKAVTAYNGDMDLPYRDRYGNMMESGKTEDKEEEGDQQGVELDDADDFGDDGFDGLDLGEDISLDMLEDGEDIDGDERGGSEDEGAKLYAELTGSKRRKVDNALSLDENDDSLYNENDFAPGTKRASTWEMLTNKGLTPHRKKENRNPRVKKRMRFEAAKKKLKSIRAVAVDRSKVGPYKGELTGIKTSISKSRRF
ncbi:Sas10 C-terminal domain-containing protein [Chytridium lagenaria]|nr:Sas10 C-terminal domain-containing protein [Chytridium lagenaria]